MGKALAHRMNRDGSVPNLLDNFNCSIENRIAHMLSTGISLEHWTHIAASIANPT
jgi:hypothetical protein